MNSALQCLSHTYPLTRHFLTNAYKTDLNEESTYGSGGRIAKEFDALLKDLWFGTSRVVSPVGLRKAIVRFQNMFVGNSQHDAQELLQYLLDGLHEDLNRIHKKPYFPTPENDIR